MKHAYTRRSNVNSKAQANMHTSWNHQCNPDMQYSNTWTMETSHDCKSNTKSNKNWVLLEGLGEQVGFQLWLKWGVCLCVANGERQIIPGYGTLIGERSLAWVFLFEQRDLQFIYFFKEKKKSAHTHTRTRTHTHTHTRQREGHTSNLLGLVLVNVESIIIIIIWFPIMRCFHGLCIAALHV